MNCDLSLSITKPSVQFCYLNELLCSKCVVSYSHECQFAIQGRVQNYLDPNACCQLFFQPIQGL